MKQLLKWTGLILFAAVVGLALAFAFTAVVRSQPSNAAPLQPAIQATPYLSDQPWGFGPGMMGRGGPGYGGWGMGPGMMGGGYRSGAQDQAYPGSGTPITLDQAVEAANQYLSAYGSSDLTLTEVMEFSNNFYAEVKEKFCRNLIPFGSFGGNDNRQQKPQHHHQPIGIYGQMTERS